MFGPGAVEAPRTRKTSRSEIAAAKMGFSYSFAGAGAAAPPKVFAPSARRRCRKKCRRTDRAAARPAARYFDAAASARPASSRSRSRASTPDHHDRYRDGLSVAGRAVGSPSFAVGSPVRSATSRGPVGDAGGSVVRPGSTTMEAAANAPREKGTPRKAVVRPASAFRGEEGRFRGDLTRTDVEGEGRRGGVCVRRGDGGERGGGERGGGGAGEERVDASRVGASSPSSRPASARPAWR